MTEAPPLDVAALVRTHQTAIWRYLRLLGAEAAEAEDLCQETFLEVLRRPFDDAEPRATSAYLRRVARNLLLKRRRHERNKPTVAFLDQVDAAWQRLASDGGEEHLTALRACLDTLPDRTRRGLELRYANGQGRRDIAKALGMGEEAVKTMLRRARASLKQCIDRRMRP